MLEDGIADDVSSSSDNDQRQRSDMNPNIYNNNPSAPNDEKKPFVIYSNNSDLIKTAGTAATTATVTTIAVQGSLKLAADDSHNTTDSGSLNQEPPSHWAPNLRIPCLADTFW